MKISVKKETKAHALAYWIWPTIVLYFQGLKVTKLRFTASKSRFFLSRYPILSYPALHILEKSVQLSVLINDSTGFDRK